MASGISEEDRKRKGTKNRYQEQKHNMRTTYVSSTTKIDINRTRGVTVLLDTCDDLVATCHEPPLLY